MQTKLLINGQLVAGEDPGFFQPTVLAGARQDDEVVGANSFAKGSAAAP